MQEPKIEVPRHIKQRPGGGLSAPHYAKILLFILNPPGPGKLLSGNKKRAIPTSTKEGDVLDLL